MKQNKLGWKLWLVFGVLTLLPLVMSAIAVLWFLPDTIPAHYGASGQVDRWGSKYESFILPGIVLPFGLFMLGMVKVASRQEGAGRKSRFAVALCGVVSLLVMDGLNAFFLYTSFREVEQLWQVPGLSLRALFFVLGLVLMVLGAAMPRAKRNLLLGVRTKETLESESVWAKSQKLGGKLFLGAGAVCLVSVLLPETWMTAVSCAAVTAAAIGSVLYAKREGRREQAGKTGR